MFYDLAEPSPDTTLLLDKRWIISEPEKAKKTPVAGKIAKTLFSQGLISVPLFVYACGAHLAVMIDQYTDAKFDPRNDWTIEGQCSVYDENTQRQYNFSTKAYQPDLKTTKIVPHARVAFQKCKDILDNPKIKPTVTADMDLFIKTEKGFDGSVNSSVAGIADYFEPKQIEEAKDSLDEYSYYALRRKVQTTGHFGNGEWWELQALTAQREIATWPSRAYTSITETANAAYNGAIDGTISLLQQAKQQPKPPSP